MTLSVRLSLLSRFAHTNVRCCIVSLVLHVGQCQGLGEIPDIWHYMDVMLVSTSVRAFGGEGLALCL